MKNLLLVILSVLFLTSCGNTPTVTKNEDQTLSAVNDIINPINYNIVDGGETDTFSLVKIDSVVLIKNRPVVNYTTDTSEVKIIGHTNINLIVFTVKQQLSGYTKKSTMVIGYVQNKKPFLIGVNENEGRINKIISEYKLNDVEKIKLEKQKILDYAKYTNI
jgi:hypothetical protein